MSAYVIFEEDVFDPEGLQAYIQQAPPILAQYGGRLLTAGGRIESLEGSWQPTMMVILQFDSFEQAQRWYASEEYSEVKKLRQRASHSRVILVEGTSGIEIQPHSVA